jgi:hypothetical protein
MMSGSRRRIELTETGGGRFVYAELCAFSTSLLEK